MTASAVATFPLPRIKHHPPDLAGSKGWEAVELAQSVGLVLDDWQSFTLAAGCTSNGAGWMTRNVGVEVPRQNGKGGILEARELAGMFVWGESGLHTAHEQRTSDSAFKRLVTWIESFDWLIKQTKSIRRANGQQAIIMLDGRELKFTTRTPGAGRGLSGPLLIVDEAMVATDEQMEAIGPVQSAFGMQAQTWFTASAGFDDSVVLRRLRERALAGEDARLAYLAWCAAQDADLDDREAWAGANPGHPHRITEQTIADERAMMSDEGIARERMGIWGRRDVETVISMADWLACADPQSRREGAVVFAADAPPDRSSAGIGVAGRREDQLPHVEVVEEAPGVDWVAGRLIELGHRHDAGVILDGASAVAAYADDIAAAGVQVTITGPRDMAQACGRFYDTVLAGGLRHIEQAPLAAALGSATKRKLGDAWAWQRRDAANISPLVCVTLALWGLSDTKPKKRSSRAKGF